MRRTILLAATTALLAGALAVPATAVTSAGSGSKARFEASGWLTVSNVPDETGVLPAFVNGVTVTEFRSNCAVPPTTQGFDGYVIELPSRMRGVAATVKLQSSPGGSLIRDAYMLFFDRSCRYKGQAGWYSEDDTGSIEAGTAYILVSASKGAQIRFTLKVEATR